MIAITRVSEQLSIDKLLCGGEKKALNLFITPEGRIKEAYLTLLVLNY